MASPESMKKEELVAQVRKLSQELKRLLAENEELKSKTENSIGSTSSLKFDTSAVALVAKDDKFELHSLNYASGAGQAILISKLSFDKRHMAEYKALELFHTKTLKGELA